MTKALNRVDKSSIEPAHKKVTLVSSSPHRSRGEFGIDPERAKNQVIVRLGNQNHAASGLKSLVPERLLELARRDEQRSIPAIAKDSEATELINGLLRDVPTVHRLILGDAREIVDSIPDESVHLAITSPPYWTLKRYNEHTNQLGHISDYDEFLDEISLVWKGILRTLVPGGRLVVVVGDVCLSRRDYGRHVVVPLHASIQDRCRMLGYDNLAPIIWHKISNARLEVPNGSNFMGKPYEPNAVIKNDIEFILFQRKPGGYRRTALASRILSVIPIDLHKECFQQIWSIGGASTKHHPAPFPLLLAERLVRMFSFVGDTVLDPFAGTATSNVAAARLGRNSIGIEVDPAYFNLATAALKENSSFQTRLSG